MLDINKDWLKEINDCLKVYLNATQITEVGKRGKYIRVVLLAGSGFSTSKVDMYKKNFIFLGKILKGNNEISTKKSEFYNIIKNTEYEQKDRKIDLIGNTSENLSKADKYILGLKKNQKTTRIKKKERASINEEIVCKIDEYTRYRCLNSHETENIQRMYQHILSLQKKLTSTPTVEITFPIDEMEKAYQSIKMYTKNLTQLKTTEEIVKFCMLYFFLNYFDEFELESIYKTFKQNIFIEKYKQVHKRNEDESLFDEEKKREIIKDITRSQLKEIIKFDNNSIKMTIEKDLIDFMKKHKIGDKDEMKDDTCQRIKRIIQIREYARYRREYKYLMGVKAEKIEPYQKFIDEVDKESANADFNLLYVLEKVILNGEIEFWYLVSQINAQNRRKSKYKMKTNINHKSGSIEKKNKRNGDISYTVDTGKKYDLDKIINAIDIDPRLNELVKKEKKSLIELSKEEKVIEYVRAKNFQELCFRYYDINMLKNIKEETWRNYALKGKNIFEFFKECCNYWNRKYIVDKVQLGEVKQTSIDIKSEDPKEVYEKLCAKKVSWIKSSKKNENLNYIKQGISLKNHSFNHLKAYLDDDTSDINELLMNETIYEKIYFEFIAPYVIKRSHIIEQLQSKNCKWLEEIVKDYKGKKGGDSEISFILNQKEVRKRFTSHEIEETKYAYMSEVEYYTELMSNNEIINPGEDVTKRLAMAKTRINCIRNMDFDVQNDEHKAFLMITDEFVLLDIYIKEMMRDVSFKGESDEFKRKVEKKAYKLIKPLIKSRVICCKEFLSMSIDEKGNVDLNDNIFDINEKAEKMLDVVAIMHKDYGVLYEVKDIDVQNAKFYANMKM